MNTFIQENKNLFKFYSNALRLSGWILLVFGLCSFAIKIFLARILGNEALIITSVNMPLTSLHSILFGGLGIGIAQLIQYCFDSKSKPGFILRHSGKFLYTYVALLLIMMIMRNIYTITFLQHNDIGNAQILYFSTSITSVVLFATEALILIGVSQFLKRLIPIIEEYKTLV